MDHYPMYGLLVGFSLWGTLWRLLFTLGFWNTFTCRVETRGGTGTIPCTKGQEEEAAKILGEGKARKEKKELVKQAKKLALLKEQTKKKKQLEEEMEKLKKEDEEKLKAVEEEEVDEEVPLVRTSTRERGEPSGTKREDEWMEKKVFEWVANLSLGEDEEAMLYVPREQEAVVKKLEAKEDPLRCRTIEEEKKLEWKLRLTREKRQRMNAANKMVKELKMVEEQRTQMERQEDLQGKMEVMAMNIEVLAKAVLAKAQQ
ncbi:hypothetical protein CBR_g54909 [Chara braunii]|uniref:Uncharacterized protein n=1 Tax=Chara braunii TaxID=69332 RepID=A0A388JPU9_CHABU|nr:hypothetical protein CBR_g54909 [Chara braunii]|eukprot:GBG59807.1 hypothetical protein CBR_g54909 [Chara braunii]